MTSKNSSSSSSSSGGIGLAGLLTVLFVALELLHKVTWSWLWVLSPLWISALAAVAIIAAVLGGAFLVMAIKGRK